MKINFPQFLFLIVSILMLVLPYSAANPTRKKTDDIKPEVLLRLLDRAHLQISARVYYGAGDEAEIPVKTDFYLLDKSVVDVLKDAKFSPESDNGASPTETIGDDAFLEALARLLAEQPDEEAGMLSYLFCEALNKHTAARFETDYFGFGKSATVKAGNYYLFGYTMIDDEMLIWNYPVFLSGGRAIEIDQDNAAAIIYAE